MWQEQQLSCTKIYMTWQINATKLKENLALENVVNICYLVDSTACPCIPGINYAL